MVQIFAECCVVYPVHLWFPVYFVYMRLFGLKSERIWDWEEVLEDELGSVGWGDRGRLIWGMVKALIQGLRGRKSQAELRVQFRYRMKTCMKCPIYNSHTKTCRPFRGSQLGCGCYMPYAAQLKDKCWAKEYLPDEDLGW
jgi:hypothetical protein